MPEKTSGNKETKEKEEKTHQEKQHMLVETQMHNDILGSGI